MLRFRSTVQLAGKTATGMPVPTEVVESLGAGRRPAVRVTVGGHTYRTTVGTRGGEFKLPLSAENRERAGVSAGEEVEVAIELDTEPRELTVPPDFAAALGRDARASRFFDGLSYSRKQRIVLSVEGAKTEETRRRRIAKAISGLREGRA
jgi:hypothetical protein